jgi:outer membrane protein assembly factor BamB
VDGKAYLVSGAGEAVCLSVADGKTLWKVDGKTFASEVGRWGAAESPLVFDGMVIFSPAGKQTAVVALDPQTGATIWQSRSLNHRGAYVSPQLVQHNGAKQIVGLDGQCVYGINPSNGAVLWTFEDYPVSKKEGYKICVNTPLCKDGKIYVSNGYNLGSFLLQLADKLDTVSLVWRNEDLDTHIGGQVLVNGTLYGSSWHSNSKGNWVAVDWNTGQTTYNTDWGGGRTKGSIAAADGKLFIYDEKRGTVALLNATPDKFDVAGEFQIKHGEGPHWAHPVIADGVLYIRHGSYLMAYKIS